MLRRFAGSSSTLSIAVGCCWIACLEGTEEIEMICTRSRVAAARSVRATALLCGVALLLASSSVTAGPAVIASRSERTVLSLDGAWTVTADVNRGVEVAVRVPGNFPITGGVVTWRRSFFLDLARRPRVAFIEFGGATHQASVRLNGVALGRLHAHSRARFHVTSTLVLVGENVLEVALDDRLTSTTVPGGPVEPLVPLIGPDAYALVTPWTPLNGIIRDIALVHSDAPVVEDVFAAPVLSADLSQAQVHVRIHVAGMPPSDEQVAVALHDHGTLVGEQAATRFGAGEFEAAIAVPAPHLWSPRDPHLYDLSVVVLDGEPVDAVVEQVGLRRFETVGNRFYLNGEPIFLRGITRHDLYGDAGFVADPALYTEDVQRILSLGANYVRCVHYPPDEGFVRLADRAGLLLSIEIPAWALLSEPAVAAEAVEMVAAMIERDFNRASVVFWIAGTGEEIADVTDYFPSVRAVAKSIDPHRPIGFAFDDAAKTPEDVLANLEVARSTGMDFLAQVGYWDESSIDAVVAALPEDFPVLIAEWTGSEGSDRGPIGLPGMTGFPEVPDPEGTGVFSESFQVSSMLGAALPWFPHLLNGPPPIAGLVYFNWQDLDWIGAAHLFPGHGPALRSGLVYEDRKPKLAFSAFQLVMDAFSGIDAAP